VANHFTIEVKARLRAWAAASHIGLLLDSDHHFEPDLPSLEQTHIEQVTGIEQRHHHLQVIAGTRASETVPLGEDLGHHLVVTGHL
jgi:hypothetical protein